MEPFPTPPQTSAREGFRAGEAAVGAQWRLLRAGAQVLSDPELLSILCHAGRSEAATLRLARELLDEHGGLAGLMVAGPENLRQSGLGTDGLAVLLATRELACRLAQGQISGRAPLLRPAETARYLHLRYHLRDQEVFGALFLDLQRRLIADREIFRGTLARAAARHGKTSHRPVQGLRRWNRRGTRVGRHARRHGERSRHPNSGYEPSTPIRGAISSATSRERWSRSTPERRGRTSATAGRQERIRSR
jgi:hypothetical protein